MDEQKPLRSYGRIKARTLKPRQERLLETLLPQLAIPDGPINLDALFKRPSPLAGEGREGGRPDVPTLAKLARPSPPTPSPRGRGGYVLEIGFGGGEHLVAQARAHPEQDYLGVEPFLNGIASCLRHIEEQILPQQGGGDPPDLIRGIGGGPDHARPLAKALNIRLHQGDARDILARLPPASLSRIDILFPDPWPKSRHHKRRLVQPAFIAACARVLKPGAELRFATDWKNYAAWTLDLFLKSSAFTWPAERADDWRKPWPDHVKTRYEQKKLGDCVPIYLRFSRADLS